MTKRKEYVVYVEGAYHDWRMYVGNITYLILPNGEERAIRRSRTLKSLRGTVLVLRRAESLKYEFWDHRFNHRWWLWEIVTKEDRS